MKRVNYLMTVCLIAGLWGCNKHDQPGLDRYMQGQIAQWNRNLTDVIIADIFTPPQASRIYAYPNIAAYEVMHLTSSEHNSMSQVLKDLPSLDSNAQEQVYHPLAGIIAFSGVAQKLVYNGPAIEEMESKFLEEVKQIGIDQEVYQSSIDFGRTVAAHILAWAEQDGYNQRTALPGYTVTNEPGRWQPTPPDYMDAIEPHWNTIRPFLLDSATQYTAGIPTEFDTIPQSAFYEGTMEVYNAVNNLDEEQLEIAKFWDCNPNISYTQGHVMYYQQQISPGGHWIHITAQVLDAESADLLRSSEVMTMVSVTLADAFISCWSEKYRSNLIRPETYINQYIDKDWKPILQTPAFPEHTSGHSVASSSAAVMLTHIFGDQYAFADSTEVPFGLPTRQFDSFIDAAQEAAISRLYGGIHYMPAITYGVSQGKAVGSHAVTKFKNQ